MVRVTDWVLLDAPAGVQLGFVRDVTSADADGRARVVVVRWLDASHSVVNAAQLWRLDADQELALVYFAFALGLADERLLTTVHATWAERATGSARGPGALDHLWATQPAGLADGFSTARVELLHEWLGWLRQRVTRPAPTPGPTQPGPSQEHTLHVQLLVGEDEVGPHLVVMHEGAVTRLSCPTPGGGQEVLLRLSDSQDPVFGVLLDLAHQGYSDRANANVAARVKVTLNRALGRLHLSHRVETRQDDGFLQLRALRLIPAKDVPPPPASIRRLGQPLPRLLPTSAGPRAQALVDFLAARPLPAPFPRRGGGGKVPIRVQPAHSTSGLQVADWVYVPPSLREAETGLGYVVEPASLNDDETLATARVHFVGQPTGGRVYSVGNLRRVPPHEELAVVVTAWLRGLVDDGFMAEARRRWQRCNHARLRGPGLLSRLWESKPPGLVRVLASYQPDAWSAALEAVGAQAREAVRDAGTADESVTSAPAPREDIVWRTADWDADEDAADSLDLEAGPELDFGDEACPGFEGDDGPPVTGQVTCVLEAVGDPPAFQVCVGARCAPLLYGEDPATERRLRPDFSSASRALVALAKRGYTRSTDEDVLLRLTHSLRTALLGLQLDQRIELVRLEDRYCIRGLHLAAGEGVSRAGRVALLDTDGDDLVLVCGADSVKIHHASDSEDAGAPLRRDETPIARGLIDLACHGSTESLTRPELERLLELLQATLATLEIECEPMVLPDGEGFLVGRLPILAGAAFYEPPKPSPPPQGPPPVAEATAPPSPTFGGLSSTQLEAARARWDALAAPPPDPWWSGPV